MHHDGKFIQNANATLEYVSGEFCFSEEVETYLVNVWITHKLGKTWHNYVKFALVYYLVPDINDRDVLSMCQIGLANPKKKRSACILRTC